MKKIFNYLVIGIMITFTSISCNNWLEVSPSGTVKAEDLFKESYGYRVALNGIYNIASDPALYGREMSWGLLSAMSNDYAFGSQGLSSSSGYYDVYYGDYDTEEATALVDGIWNKAYFAIANANALLDKIKDAEESSFVLGALEKDLITGEALAMRAKMHFDILRLFTPSVKMDDGEPYMPYYGDSGLSTGELDLTVNEVIAKILVDIEEAEKLVAPFDVMPGRIDMIDDIYRINMTWGLQLDDELEAHKDVFFALRAYRMNIIAIKHLKAAVYLHKGDIDKAYEVVEWLYDFNENVKGIYSYQGMWNIADQPKSPYEVVLGFSNPNIYDLYEPYSVYTNISGQQYLGLSDDLISLFGIDLADYRYKDLTEVHSSSKFRRSVKFREHQTKELPYSSLIPVMGYTDIIFIEAEYHALKGNFAEAAKTLETLRIARNCTEGNITPLITDMDSFYNVLLAETRRENFSYGKSYYTYKRLNKLIHNRMKQEDFVLVKPVKESSLL